jgi:lauroyl/myristoyl acyltransferase
MGTGHRHADPHPSVPARLLALVIDVAAAVGSRLPARLTHGLAVVGGTLEWLMRPGLRRTLAINLSHAIGAPPDSPTVRRAVRHEIVNEARRSADLLWAIGDRAAFLDSVRVDGADRAASTARRGDGMLLVGTHLGGWEVATPVPAVVVPVPTTVITADDWLAWGIDHVRDAAGLHTIRTDGVLAALRVLRRGECLLLLGDHALDPRTRRLRVEFCGSAAELPAGVVTLARLARSPIVTFDVLPLGPRRWLVTVGEPIEPPATADDEQAVLQTLADRWTATIRAHPEHWSARFPIAWDDPA